MDICTLSNISFFLLCNHREQRACLNLKRIATLFSQRTPFVPLMGTNASGAEGYYHASLLSLTQDSPNRSIGAGVAQVDAASAGESLELQGTSAQYRDGYFWVLTRWPAEHGVELSANI